MKKTIGQRLNVKEFPITTRDAFGKLLYEELSNGSWKKYKYKDTKYGDTEITVTDSFGNRTKIINEEDGCTVYVRNCVTGVTEYDKYGIDLEFTVSATADELDTLAVEQLYKILGIELETRDTFTWGTYGKNHDQPLKRVYLKDMSNEHILMILCTQRQISRFTQRVFMDELNLRFKNPELSISENS